MTSKKTILRMIAIGAILASIGCMTGCYNPFSTKSFSGEDSISMDVNDSSEKTSSSKSTTASTQSEDIVMSILGDADTYVVEGEDYIESGCQAVDKKSGVITDQVQVSGDVDTSTPGDYEITYSVETKDGKYGSAKRDVHVVDSLEKSASKVPVLMYHYVYTEDDVPDNLNGNYLLDTKLEQQCSYLKENDYYFPSFQELRAWVDGKHTLPAKSVILTFDDGQSGFFKYGVPILEKYEVPATSFVIASKAAKRVKKYASPYIQYQSHSYNMHRAGGGNIGRGGVIYAYSQDDVEDDIAKSNEVTGDAVAFAYPFGDNDEKARTALDESGILCAFTIVNDKISQGDDPMALNRVRISGEYGLDSYKSLVSPNN